MNIDAPDHCATPQAMRHSDAELVYSSSDERCFTMIAVRRRPHGRRPVLAAAALLGACAVFHFQAPDITPTAVELVDVQLNEQRFRVTLHVYNPNDRALPIKSAHCKLEIEGVEVGSGETTAPFN